MRSGRAEAEGNAKLRTESIHNLANFISIRPESKNMKCVRCNHRTLNFIIYISNEHELWQTSHSIVNRVLSDFPGTTLSRKREREAPQKHKFMASGNKTERDKVSIKQNTYSITLEK